MDSKTIAARSDFDGFTRSRNLYVVLGIESSASSDEIKTAYRKLALLFHPDRHQGGEKQRAEEVFKRISAAYKILADPEERRDYDELLRRGAEAKVKPRAAEQEIDPLAQILEDILKYEHIFATKWDLWHFKKDLRKMVEESLITELKEEIVGVFNIREVPIGYEHKGTFKRGSMVITNLRLLFPFLTQWQVVRGNVTTTYTQGYLRGMLLPQIGQVTITTLGRIQGKTRIELQCKDQSISVAPEDKNLGKLLLLCSLWGVPVSTKKIFDRSKEIRSAILSVPAVVATLLVSSNVFVALCGMCSSETIPRALLIFNAGLIGIGLLPLALLISATAAGIGIFRSLRTYGRVQIEDLLAEENRT